MAYPAYPAYPDADLFCQTSTANPDVSEVPLGVCRTCGQRKSLCPTVHLCVTCKVASDKVAEAQRRKASTESADSALGSSSKPETLPAESIPTTPVKVPSDFQELKQKFLGLCQGNAKYSEHFYKFWDKIMPVSGALSEVSNWHQASGAVAVDLIRLLMGEEGMLVPIMQYVVLYFQQEAVTSNRAASNALFLIVTSYTKLCQNLIAFAGNAKLNKPMFQWGLGLFIKICKFYVDFIQAFATFNMVCPKAGYRALPLSERYQSALMSINHFFSDWVRHIELSEQGKEARRNLLPNEDVKQKIINFFLAVRDCAQDRNFMQFQIERELYSQLQFQQVKCGVAEFKLTDLLKVMIGKGGMFDDITRFYSESIARVSGGHKDLFNLFYNTIFSFFTLCGKLLMLKINKKLVNLWDLDKDAEQVGAEDSVHRLPRDFNELFFNVNKFNTKLLACLRYSELAKALSDTVFCGGAYAVYQEFNNIMSNKMEARDTRQAGLIQSFKLYTS